MKGAEGDGKRLKQTGRETQVLVLMYEYLTKRKKGKKIEKGRGENGERREG